MLASQRALSISAPKNERLQNDSVSEWEVGSFTHFFIWWAEAKPSQMNIKVQNIALNLYFTVINICFLIPEAGNTDLRFEEDQGKGWENCIVYDKTTMIEETKK